jgi:hypothetical protein
LRSSPADVHSNSRAKRELLENSPASDCSVLRV